MDSIQTDRLTLRPVVAEDWKAIQEIWKDFSTSPFYQYDRPHCLQDEEVQSQISRWAKANEGMEHMFFAVCLKETVIGYIACNVRENGYELGYCFHSDYHGKGYAKESHLALFAHLRKLGIQRLTAGTALANTPSVALLSALGFRCVGTEKVSFYQDADGKDIYFDGGIFELMI